MEKALFKLFRAAMTVYLWPRSARDKNLSVYVCVGLWLIPLSQTLNPETDNLEPLNICQFFTIVPFFLF
jgi:hypothetical protein